MRRATEQYGLKWTCETDFYPRSPCGERPKRPKRIPVKSIFLSTLSLRRATISSANFNYWSHDFYPRSPCGERPENIQKLISICLQFLSTLSLRRATSGMAKRPDESEFLSTLSLRRATCASSMSGLLLRHFYPRSPCGERRVAVFVRCAAAGISIHALLAESDLQVQAILSPSSRFLSTLSLRRATC